jgi:hypothetical protein
VTSINPSDAPIVMQLDVDPRSDTGVGATSAHRMTVIDISPLPNDRAHVLGRMEALRHRHAHQLGPILSALELLADSQRVIRDLEAAAAASASLPGAGPDSLGQALRAACPTWRDPIRELPGECGLSVIQQLARVAAEVGSEISSEWEALIESLRPAAAVGKARQSSAGR